MNQLYGLFVNIREVSTKISLCVLFLVLGIMEMSNLVNKINKISKDQGANITLSDLRSMGLGDVIPHDYQMFGVNWLTKVYLNKDKYGVLLGDEMGLGKTLQVRSKFLVCT